MHPTHLKMICEKFHLGIPSGTMSSISGSRGGSFLWRIETNQTSYAIKQLSSQIDISNPKIVAKYELSEKIAFRFAEQGIPAVFALDASGHRLTLIENIGYLVYPWVEGQILKSNEISQTHALKIAEIIAELHKVNMSVAENQSLRFDIYSNDAIITAIDKAVSLKCPFAQKLNEKRNVIFTVNKKYHDAIPVLKAESVITHGDMDRLNIIWQGDEPKIIDWESARKMNPTHDVIRTSLGWSRVGLEQFSFDIYNKMLQTYKKSGGLLNKQHIEPALQAGFGSMIHWMIYNIEIACMSDSDVEKNRACEQIESVMSSMMKLQDMIPQLLKVDY